MRWCILPFGFAKWQNCFGALWFDCSGHKNWWCHILWCKLFIGRQWTLCKMLCEWHMAKLLNAKLFNQFEWMRVAYELSSTIQMTMKADNAYLQSGRLHQNDLLWTLCSIQCKVLVPSSHHSAALISMNARMNHQLNGRGFYLNEKYKIMYASIILTLTCAFIISVNAAGCKTVPFNLLCRNNILSFGKQQQQSNQTFSVEISKWMYRRFNVFQSRAVGSTRQPAFIAMNQAHFCIYVNNGFDGVLGIGPLHWISHGNRNFFLTILIFRM